MMLIVNASGEKILLIRHAYGRRHIWTIPGGGYWPSRETPEDAAIREVWEEVGVKVTDIAHLSQMKGSSVSKRDTRHVYKGTLQSQIPVVTAEIEEQRWVTWDEARTLRLSKVTEFALQLCEETGEKSSEF